MYAMNIAKSWYGFYIMQYCSSSFCFSDHSLHRMHRHTDAYAFIMINVTMRSGQLCYFTNSPKNKYWKKHIFNIGNSHFLSYNKHLVCYAAWVMGIYMTSESIEQWFYDLSRMSIIYRICSCNYSGIRPEYYSI